MGAGGVASDAERGKGPVSGSLRDETAPGAGGSSSMALPRAYIEAEVERVSASKSIAGRGSSGPDIDQSRGADEALGVVSSSSAAGQEEGSWWEAALTAGKAGLALGVVIGAFPVTDLQGPPSERTQSDKIRDLKSLAKQYARDRGSCDDTRISYLEYVESEAEADWTLARMIAG
jgi:hypothetical protein